jgi:hypothetical protein
MNKITTTLIASLVLLSCLSGCNSKKQVMEKPDNLINRITLVNILADSYLIESTLQLSPNDTLGRDELARLYYKDLFDRYHITNEQFESSVAYYISEEKSAEKLLNDAATLIVSKKTEMSMAE